MDRLFSSSSFPERGQNKLLRGLVWWMVGKDKEAAYIKDGWKVISGIYLEFEKSISPRRRKWGEKMKPSPILMHSGIENLVGRKCVSICPKFLSRRNLSHSCFLSFCQSYFCSMHHDLNLCRTANSTQ